MWRGVWERLEKNPAAPTRAFRRTHAMRSFGVASCGVSVHGILQSEKDKINEQTMSFFVSIVFHQKSVNFKFCSGTLKDALIANFSGNE